MNEENWSFCNEQDRHELFQYSAVKQSRLPHCMMVKIQAENFKILNKVLTSNGLEPMTRTMSCMNFIDLFKLNESNQPKQLFRSKTTDFGKLRWREKAFSVSSSTIITVESSQRTTDVTVLVKSESTYELSLCFEKPEENSDDEIQEQLQETSKCSSSSVDNIEISSPKEIYHIRKASCESLLKQRQGQPNIIRSSSCMFLQRYSSDTSCDTNNSSYDYEDDSEDEESKCSDHSAKNSTCSDYCLQEIFDRVSIGSDLFVMKISTGMKRFGSGSDISIDAPSTLYESFDTKSLLSLDDDGAIPPPGKLRKFETFEDLRELPFPDDSSEDEGISSTDDMTHNKDSCSKFDLGNIGINFSNDDEFSDLNPSSIDISHGNENTQSDFDTDNASITESNDDTFSDFDPDSYEATEKSNNLTFDLEFDSESLNLKDLFGKPDDTISNIDNTEKQGRRHKFFRQLRKSICHAFRKFRCY